MASFRCMAFTPNLRIILKSCPPSFSNNLPKLLDASRVCAVVPSTVNNQFISSRNLSKGPLLFSTFLHDSQVLVSPFCKPSVPETFCVSVRDFSTNQKLDANKVTDDNKVHNEVDGKDDNTLTVFQRFRKTYKEHGKILIGVHCVTSVVWFGSFYMAAVSGVDIVPLMEQLGLSETLIKPFRAGGLGFVALAYLMYKLATPARYTVTLGGTNMVIRYMRRSGKMDPIPEAEKIRNLYKDGKVELKDRHLLFRERRAVFIRNRKLSRQKDS